MCSMGMVLFIVALASGRLFEADPPRWWGVVCGLSLITALTSGVTCMVASVCGVRRSSREENTP